MKILIDGRSLLPIGPGLGPTGVGRWTAGVIAGLSASAPSWQIVVVILSREPVDLDLSHMGSNVSLRVIPWDERWFRRRLVFGWPPRVSRFVGDVDAMLGPGFVTWPGPYAEIPVIHDLAFLTHASSVARRNLIFLRLLMPRVLKRARAVVTVSNAVREQISDRLGFDRDRVHVVPNAGELVARAEDGSGVVPGSLLFVGTFEPRKNLGRVLDAYELLRSRNADPPPLVVVGGPGWRDAEQLQKRAAETEGVVCLGYVDDSRLAALYRDAGMLLFPSLYEGFGLPIVEAFTAGTPVITSDRGGIREVAADAAVYVDPDDPGDIAAAIERVLADPDLTRRLVDEGRERAGTFTWERAGVALKHAIKAAVTR